MTTDNFDPYKRIHNVRKAIKKYEKTTKGKTNAKKYQLMSKYGLTLDEYAIKLKEQNHCCAICGIDEVDLSKGLVVDHDHATGKVRDLLCNNCNAGIGMLNEDIKVLASAISYLTKHKETI